jgi:hypothetical protein
VEAKPGRKMKVYHTSKKLIAIDIIFGGRPGFKFIFGSISANEIKVEN